MLILEEIKLGKTAHRPPVPTASDLCNLLHPASRSLNPSHVSLSGSLDLCALSLRRCP